jgi:tetrahydromethanopterin S-methyltransferase subunit A
MKAAEIIAELPKLTTEERSAVRQRLRELEQKDDMQFHVESAKIMFEQIDEEEKQDTSSAAPSTGGL